MTPPQIKPGEPFMVRDGRRGRRYCIDNELFRDGWVKAMGHATTIVYHCLVLHTSFKDQESWPSYETIAKLCGVARRTAIRAIKKLTEMRMVVKTQGKKYGKLLNIYVLTDSSEWVRTGDIVSPVTSDHSTGDMRSPALVTSDHSSSDLMSLKQTHEQTHEQEKEHGHVAAGSAAIAFGGSLAALWKQAMHEYRYINRTVYEQWLGESRLLSLDLENGTAEVGVRDAYAVEWCDNRLRDRLETLLSDHAGYNGTLTITFSVVAPLTPQERGAMIKELRT